jgi:hypothetical protein
MSWGAVLDREAGRHHGRAAGYTDLASAPAGGVVARPQGSKSHSSRIRTSTSGPSDASFDGLEIGLGPRDLDEIGAGAVDGALAADTKVGTGRAPKTRAGKVSRPRLPSYGLVPLLRRPHSLRAHQEEGRRGMGANFERPHQGRAHGRFARAI